MSVVLNSTRPIILEKNIVQDFSSEKPRLHKYVPLRGIDKLFLSIPMMNVIGAMERYLKPGYASNYIDVKVKELDVGDCGCQLEYWHIDVTRNPMHNSKPDNHIIFSTVVGTEFMLNEIPCDVEDFSDIMIPSQPEIMKAPANAIVQYNRFNMHRGPVVDKPCKRVLIRLTQTDVF